MKLSAKQCRMAALGVAILLAMPLSWGPLTGLYLWTSPFLMLNKALARHELVMLNALAVLVLVLILCRRRWYCKWLCPAGVLCDAVSKKRESKTSPDRMPELNRMLVITSLVIAALGVPLLSILDPINIFNAFFDAFRKQPADVLALKLSGLLFVVAVNLIVPHVWCLKLCPLGGLQDMLTSFRHFLTKRKKMDSPFLASRRLLLGALVGLGLGLVIKKTSDSSKTNIRPPGALPDEQFKTTCLRCGNCARVCPSDIIRTSLDPSDMMGMLTPRIVFDTGYCLPGCIACGSSCSSGAIRRFALPDKKKLRMGIARIIHDGCLLSEHKECDLCRRFCEYDAIVIRSSGSEISAWPEIIEDRCVGCGACLVICPVSVFTVVPV